MWLKLDERAEDRHSEARLGRPDGDGRAERGAEGPTGVLARIRLTAPVPARAPGDAHLAMAVLAARAPGWPWATPRAGDSRIPESSERWVANIRCGPRGAAEGPHFPPGVAFVPYCREVAIARSSSEGPARPRSGGQRPSPGSRASCGRRARASRHGCGRERRRNPEIEIEASRALNRSGGRDNVAVSLTRRSGQRVPPGAGPADIVGDHATRSRRARELRRFDEDGRARAHAERRK